MKKVATFLAAGALLTGSLMLTNVQAEPNRFNHDNKTYEIVESKMNWQDAADYARGKGGYLVEINSEAEQQAIYKEIVTNAKVSPTYTVVNDGGGIAYLWIGANDLDIEGQWIWDGNGDESGEKFWEGQGANGSGNGKSVDEKYQNWGGKEKQGTANEPDDFMGQQDAAAFALEAWPKGAGFLGSTGEWNDINEDNQLYFIIEYDYADVPGQASIVDGVAETCPGVACEFLCSEPEGAAAYEWIVNPESAAEIVAQNNFAVINWNSGFAGNVSVQVRAINPLGAGEVSEEYMVVLGDVPPMPSAPNGDTAVAPNEVTESIYLIDDVPTATDYEWKIEPESAGTIKGNGNQAVVEWNELFEGEATIAVKSKNDCGESEFGEAINVKLEASVSVTQNNQLGIKVFPNPTEGSISISNDNASVYDIEIFDLSGKKIGSSRANTSVKNLNIEQAGVYYIKISYGKEVHLQKIIVE